MFVYKVSTSSELIIMFKFYVSIIIYCLRVFVVVYKHVILYTKPLTPSELVCANYDHIYVPIVMYCPRPFVVVYKHVNLL